VEDAIDDTWIVGVQSPEQQELLSRVPDKGPVYVEGPFMLWLRKQSIAYFIMRCDPFPPPPEFNDDGQSTTLALFPPIFLRLVMSSDFEILSVFALIPREPIKPLRQR
jgi:hypothetical protein